MSKLRSEWHENLLYVPGYACLFDSTGRRVDSTVHLREGRPVRSTPTQIIPPAQSALLQDPVVFGGHLPKHFGHFLLESLSRVWIYRSHEARGLPFVHFRTVFHLHERELLEAALKKHAARHIGLSEPTLLRSVFIPDQGLSLGSDYSEEMSGVYDDIREVLCGNDNSSDETPLYLSRTRLPSDRRATLGESALERRLSALGFRILHAQELPLAEQIRQVSGARNVIGLRGSALHLTIFRRLENAQTISLGARLPEMNQARVDAMRNAQHRHIHAEFPIHPRAPGLFGGRELRLGRYRSFLVPPVAERNIVTALRNVGSKRF